MALYAGGERLGWMKWFDSCFDVAEAAIDGRQLGAHAQDGDVDGLAALKAEMILGGLNHAAGRAGALVGAIDGQLAQVAAPTADLGVDAAHNRAWRVPDGDILCDQDCALPHHCPEAHAIGARSLKEGLDGEGGVDERNQARRVVFGRVAETEVQGAAGFGVHKAMVNFAPCVFEEWGFATECEQVLCRVDSLIPDSCHEVLMGEIEDDLRFPGGHINDIE
jgi:hypothetical protein